MVSISPDFQIVVAVVGAYLAQQLGQMFASRLVRKVLTTPVGLERDIVMRPIRPR